MANWTRPAVQVYQQFLTTTASVIAPFFELCIVGPAYLVVPDRAIKNADDLIHQDYQAGEALRAEYPDIVAGCTIDHSFTQSYLQNAFVKIWPAYVQGSDNLSVTLDIQNDEKVTKLSIPSTYTGNTFIKGGVAVGDVVYINVNNRVTQATVNSFKDPSTVYLSRNIATPLTATGTTFQGDAVFIRPVSGNVQLPVDPTPTGSTNLVNGLQTSASDVKLPAEMFITVSGVNYRVYSGDLFLTYRALRTYLASDFVQVTSTSQAQGIIGTSDVANPLAVATDVVYANVTGLSFKFLPIATDNKEGYIKALDLLSTNRTVYVIVPMTQDPEVIAAYKSHVTTMRLPVKSKWRKVYANLQLPVSKTIIENNDGVIQKKVSETMAYLVDSADGRFGTKSAAVGDYIDVYDATAINNYLYSVMILQILNDSVAGCSIQKYTKGSDGYTPLSGTNSTLADGTDLAVQYDVTRRLSTNGIANEMVTTAASYAERGLTLIGPSDEVVMSINSTDYIMPGYYLCVAYGALRAGFPPHQGFTTMGISGIKTIRHSNKYFTDDDLDIMAGGGIFVVIQDTTDGLPYCIYQSTTDITELKTKEDSCVATIDFASMYYRDNLKAALGKFNVNDVSVDYVRTVCNTVTQKLTSATYQYIGSIITDGTLVSVTKDVDRIKPVVKIDIPYPVNGIDLYLQIAD